MLDEVVLLVCAPTRFALSTLLERANPSCSAELTGQTNHWDKGGFTGRITQYSSTLEMLTGSRGAYPGGRSAGLRVPAGRFLAAMLHGGPQKIDRLD